MNAPPGRQTRPAGNRPSNAASVNTPADNRSVPNDRDNSEPDALFVLERNAYGLHLAPIVDHANRDLARGLDTALERRYAGAKLVEDATDAQGIAVVDQAIRVHGEMYGEVNANHVRHLIPKERVNLLPARFAALAKQGHLINAGYVRASHAEGRGRMIANWRWVS